MKILIRIFLLIFILIIIVSVILGLPVMKLKDYQIVEDQTEWTPVNKQSIDKLSEAITYKTISYSDDHFEESEFVRFHEFLKSSFPLVFTNAEVSVVNSYSLIIEWRGSDNSLEPLVLMAHQDVVPVDSTNLERWKYNPWEGKVVQDTIYGRGALDDKGGLIAQLVAIETLMEQNFTPRRTVILASGHDEEVGGRQGAYAIVKELKRKGVRPALVLDEGLYILENFVPKVESDVAFVGLAEKGYLSVELSTFVMGGHSSIPSRENAIDVINQSITKLRANPLEPRLTNPTKWFIKFLAMEMPFVEKVAFANIEIFSNMIISIYEKTNTGNAIVRTTTAPTTFHAGVKDNVVPSKAVATINYRLLPGDDKDKILEYINETLNDPRVKVDVLEYNPPSKVSCVECPAFESIHKAIERVAPEVLVAPNLMVGGSDSKHFEEISEHVYRFRPLRLNDSNINGIHGINERIAIYDFDRAIQFYKELIKLQ